MYETVWKKRNGSIALVVKKYRIDYDMKELVAALRVTDEKPTWLVACWDWANCLFFFLFFCCCFGGGEKDREDYYMTEEHGRRTRQKNTAWKKKNREKKPNRRKLTKLPMGGISNNRFNTPEITKKKTKVTNRNQQRQKQTKKRKENPQNWDNGQVKHWISTKGKGNEAFEAMYNSNRRFNRRAENKKNTMVTPEAPNCKKLRK